MKKRYWTLLAGGALGAACALIQSVTGSDVMIALLKPFTFLGNLLRAWSLSGAQRNAAAWAVLAVLSLLPVLYILIARRKRKQASDWLFFLTGAVVFGGLFLLVNPTLYVHPMMTEALDYSPELLTGGPVFAIVSMLLLSIVSRWSGGLMALKKQDHRLVFWTQFLLVGSMTLIAFSTVFTAAEGIIALKNSGRLVYSSLIDIESASVIGSDLSSGSLSAWAGGQVSNPLASMRSMGEAEETSALIGFLLTMLLLIPNLFSLWMLDAAVSLTGAMGRGWFSEETDERASRLAVRARYTMIASIGCMAAKNVLTVLLAQWIMQWNMSISLPLDDLLISCGAMLLARLLGAACRVKRDNDLMI